MLSSADVARSMRDSGHSQRTVPTCCHGQPAHAPDEHGHGRTAINGGTTLPEALEARVSTPCPPTPPPEPSTRDAAHEWRATRRSRDGNRPSVTLTKPTTPAPVGPLSTALCRSLVRRPPSRHTILPPQSSAFTIIRVVNVAQVIPAPRSRSCCRCAQVASLCSPRVRALATDAPRPACVRLSQGSSQSTVSPRVLAQHPDPQRTRLRLTEGRRRRSSCGTWPGSGRGGVLCACVRGTARGCVVLVM